MTKTFRVRVEPREYNIIKNLSNEKDITFAKATRQLIEDKNIIVGNEVVNIKNMDEKEINELIKKLEKQKEKLKKEDDKESSGAGLVAGSIVAGLIYLLSKSMKND